MKFKLLIKIKMLQWKCFFLSFKLSDVVFMMLIKFNVKMPIIVDILKFMSMINVMLS